jgi:hypothetical protein
MRFPKLLHSPKCVMIELFRKMNVSKKPHLQTSNKIRHHRTIRWRMFPTKLVSSVGARWTWLFILANCKPCNSTGQGWMGRLQLFPLKVGVEFKWFLTFVSIMSRFYIIACYRISHRCWEVVDECSQFSEWFSLNIHATQTKIMLDTLVREGSTGNLHNSTKSWAIWAFASK